MQSLSIQSNNHSELLDITNKIQKEIPDNYSGTLTLYVPHTSAAIMVNEGADPDVQTDILHFLDDLVPWDYPKFKHMEGNSAGHIKAMLVGNDQTIIVENGNLQLGTWEKIFFCEFDGPRTRKIWLKF